MKKYAVQAIFIPIIVVLVSVLNHSVARAIPIMGITPSSTTVNLGDSFTLDVTVSNVTNLGAFQFVLDFDPLLISATSITAGGFLSGGGPASFVPGAINNISGELTFTSGSLFFGSVSGSGILASIAFDTLAVGTSVVSIDDPITGLFGGGFSQPPIFSTIQNGLVQVVDSSPPGPVSEPASIILIGTALLMFAIRKNRVLT